MKRVTFGREIKNAARANLLPALGLQGVALFLLWAYRCWPAAHDALNHLAFWKQSTGFCFAFMAAACAGAILPYILQSLQHGNHRRIERSALPFLLLFWGSCGCVVDAFYQLQAALWGNNALPLTITIKIFCDLMLFSPLLATPAVVLAFATVDSNFDFAVVRAGFNDGCFTWWWRDVWPVVRIMWLVWLPAVGVIYALPIGLQLPVQVIMQCLWSLILVVATDHSSQTTPALS
jgi:hypothetical protein